MDVIVDTSCIYGDLRLEGAKIRTLCESARMIGNGIYFPEVVIMEAKNKYSEELFVSKSKIEKELSAVFRLTKHKHTSSLNDKLISTEIGQFNAEFDKKMAKLGIVSIPISNIGHRELVERALKKRKPFSETGKGYRDTLIWENIKERLKKHKQSKLFDEPAVVFLTKNWRDFCEANYDIHPDLQEDLIKSGIPPESLKIMEDIDGFIGQYVKAKQEILEKIKLQLQDKKGKSGRIHAKVEKYLFAYLHYREFDPQDLGFEIEMESPTVSGINEDYKFEIEAVRKLTDDEILIEGYLFVDCEIDVYINKSDYYGMGDDDNISVFDYDWNDHYVAASVNKILKLKILLTVDSDLSEIITQEIDIEKEKPQSKYDFDSKDFDS